MEMTPAWWEHFGKLVRELDATINPMWKITNEEMEIMAIVAFGSHAVEVTGKQRIEAEMSEHWAQLEQYQRRAWKSSVRAVLMTFMQMRPSATDGNDAFREACEVSR